MVKWGVFIGQFRNKNESKFGVQGGGQHIKSICRCHLMAESLRLCDRFFVLTLDGSKGFLTPKTSAQVHHDVDVQCAPVNTPIYQKYCANVRNIFT